MQSNEEMHASAMIKSVRGDLCVGTVRSLTSPSLVPRPKRQVRARLL